jgi:hypothetical protein
LILIAPAVVTSVASLLGDGLERLRYAAELPLLALAAWTLVWLSKNYDRVPPVAARVARMVVGERA